MACYICGGRTSLDDPHRRDIGTGTGYTGWRITNSRIVNSLFFGNRRGPSAPRSYYGRRTVCASCAAKIDEADAAKRKQVWFLVPFFLFIGLLRSITAGVLAGVLRK